MFGVDNVGVINQRNAPAIWESNVAQFPTNNIKGRLLLATDTITLYVDLINGNGGMTNRAVIASGLIGNGNGTVINNSGTGDYTVDLGGALQNETYISLDGRSINFEGGTNTIKINNNVYLESQGLATGVFYPVTVNSIGVVVPNKTLVFFSPSSGVAYKVNVQEF
jgi:hypothetical protein